MLIEASLNEEVRDELEQICKDRLPIEACGVLLPTPHRNRRVWEMPNRSLKGQTSFTMWSSDVRAELDEWIEENTDKLAFVTFWHSHPSGNVKPSDQDMESKVKGASNLVLALDSDGKLQSYFY